MLQKTLDEIGVLLDSPVGFYHFVEEDQRTLRLQAWSTRTIKEFCKAEGKGMQIGPAVGHRTQSLWLAARKVPDHDLRI